MLTERYKLGPNIRTQFSLNLVSVVLTSPEILEEYKLYYSICFSYFFNPCTVHSGIHNVHTPTNALFIKFPAQHVEQ